MDALQIVLATACGVLTLACVVALVRDVTPGALTIAGAAAIEVGLLALLVVGIVRLVGDDGDVSGPTYVGYLVGILLVLPAGVIWSRGERTRSGTGVLLVATLVVPFLLLRLHDIWAAGHVG